MNLNISSNVSKIISIAQCLSHGIEKEMAEFVNNQEQCRRRWEKSELELKRIKETEIPLKEQNKSIQVQLELARNQLDHALRKRSNYEKRIQFLEQQLSTISALLNESEIKGLDKNTLLRMTNVGYTNIMDESCPQPVKGRKSLIPSDFDESSEQDIETNLNKTMSNKRFSTFKNELPKLPKKHITPETSFEPTLITLSPDHNCIASSDMIPLKLPKPVICENYDDYQIDLSHHFDDKENINASAPRFEEHPISKSTPNGIEENKISAIVSKPHNLIPKKEIKPGKCTVCQKHIGFQRQFFRCQDCTLKCHDECKSMITSSCEITTNKIKLEDDVSHLASFKVPTLITDCIHYIETTGMNEQGLYRVSASTKDLKDIKKQIQNHIKPNLNKIHDVHIFTCLIKFYLRELSEPLITRQLHADFLDGAQRNDLNKIYKLIESLPTPNRHTLAFIILHLRKVARIQDNLMNFKGLARVMGPSLVGNGVLNPTATRLYEESQLQSVLVEVFLGISDDYWSALCKAENSQDTNMSFRTATVQSSVLDSPLLGRLDISGKKRRRYDQSSRNLFDKLGKKKFFETPVVRN